MNTVTRILLAGTFCCPALFAIPPIAVFVDFESQPSAISIAAMEREVSEIMKPTGLALEWRILNERRLDESFPDLVVVRFKGSCQMDTGILYSELGPSRENATLAATMVSDGHVLPFSDVECDRIRHYIQPNVSTKPSEQRDQVYGKALGRVVAHELYHVFANTQHHANEGVARAVHSRQDLTAKHFHFSAKESAVLHDLKWRAMMAGEAQRPDLTSQ